MVCRAVVDAELDGRADRVATYGARFTGVVLPGETLRTRLWRDGARMVFSTTVPDRDDAPVLGAGVLTVR